MASVDDLAVILGEAAQIYYTGKAFEYQQVKDRQAQANIVIDRQLATERYNSALQADVYKSEIQRLGRASDTLQVEILKNQAKYEGLTGDLFKLGDISKTSGSSQVVGDMANSGLTALSNELEQLKTEKQQYTADLSTLVSRINSIDKMRADMLRGGGGPGIAGDEELYEKEDFSYQEYLGRTEATGSEWLKSGYRAISPTELMKLNTDAIGYEYKKATTALYQAKGTVDADAMYKNVDKFLKSHWAQIYGTSSGIGTLAAANKVVAAYSSEDSPEDNPEYRRNVNLVVEERLKFAEKADPVGYIKAMKGFELGSWEDGVPFSIGDYVDYASTTGDADFKERLKEGLDDKDPKVIDFAKRANMLDTWAKNVFRTHHSAIESLKGLTNIQGTGKPLLELVDERKAQYDELIRGGMKELARKMDSDFYQVTGVNLSDENKIETFRNAVMNEGKKALKDKTLTKFDPKRTRPFIGSDDELLYRGLLMDAKENPNDEQLQADLDDMTLKLYKKYGDTELTAGTAGW